MTSQTPLKTENSTAIVPCNPSGAMQPIPIKTYAVEFWETLSEKKTAAIYKEAIIKTWELLKQAVTVIVSVFLLFVAILIWIWGYGFTQGKIFGEWLQNQGEVRQPEELVERIFKLLLDLIEKAIAWAKKQVKQFF